MNKAYLKYAKLIAQRSLRVQPGKHILLMGTASAKPLMLALQKTILEMGAYPYFYLTFPESDEIKFRYASDEQLKSTGLIEEFASLNMDAILLVHSEDNPLANARVNMSKQILAMQAMGRPMQNVFGRVAKGEMIWASCIFPTRGFAQLARMGVDTFEEMLLESVKVNTEDPLKAWEQIEVFQQKVIDSLEGADQVHILGEETDLTLSVKGRKWINCAGFSNLPDGEIYTSPVEDSADGFIYFKHPIMYKGNVAEGVKLWFEKGECVKAEAKSGEDFLKAMINLDSGSRFLGEFAIGMNEDIQIPTGHILLDEKIAGTIHLALGNGYPLTGSSNKSALHWDFICDLREGGSVCFDGKVFMKDGKLCDF